MVWAVQVVRCLGNVRVTAGWAPTRCRFTAALYMQFFELNNWRAVTFVLWLPEVACTCAPHGRWPDALLLFWNDRLEKVAVMPAASEGGGGGGGARAAARFTGATGRGAGPRPGGGGASTRQAWIAETDGECRDGVGAEGWRATNGCSRSV